MRILSAKPGDDRGHATQSAYLTFAAQFRQRCGAEWASILLVPRAYHGATVRASVDHAASPATSTASGSGISADAGIGNGVMSAASVPLSGRGNTSDRIKLWSR